MAKSPVAILYDADGNPVSVVLDGSTYRLQMGAKVARASDGAFVNPATQESVSSIDGKTPTLVSGRVPTDGSGVTQPISAASLPLPTGAATETTLGTRLAESTFTTRVPTLGQKAMVGSVAVAIASDQSAVPISMVAGSYAGQIEGRAADGATPAGNPVLIAGQDGTNVQTILTDAQGRLEIAPAGASAITKGFSDGWATLAAVAPALLFSTTYTEQTSNAQRSLVSASASDAEAGTGARKVIIRYYTATFTGPFEEEVTLNGTTAVNTAATDICYIECMRVSEAGNGASIPVGIISLKAATGGGGATIWSIAAGAGQTFGAHHYVPTGHTCFITGFYAGVKGADSAAFLIRAQDLSAATKFNRQVSDTVRVVANGSFLRSYGTPIEVAGPARIQAWVVPDSTSSRTYYGSFDFYDQDNT